MHTEKYKNKEIDEKEEIIDKDLINSGNEKIPILFELIQKIDLKFLINTDIFSSGDRLKIIHELSNKNFGILLSEKLIIVSHKTFKTIKIIRPSYDELRSEYNSIWNEFVDFIELKNCDIVLWITSVILIYDKECNLIQRIDEREHGNICKREDYDYGSTTYYDINSIFEMKNGKLVSCNSYGLKFYEKAKDQYNLISTAKIEIDVHFIYEINPNELILLQKHYDESWSDMEGDDKYLISIYNIENKNSKEVFRARVRSTMGEFKTINYIINKRYLFMCYEETMEIFNLEKNMQNIYIQNDDVYEYENTLFGLQRIMKKEKRIRRVFANFSDTLFFGEDDNGNLNIYKFNNNTLNVYYHFKIKNVTGVIKLKNNDFILYSYYCELYKFTPLFLNKNK